MHSTRVNQRSVYRVEERWPDKSRPKTSNFTEVIESLSRALETLKLLEEVEVNQLLRLHTRYFPKTGIDFFKVKELFEKSLIEHALKEANGKQTDAAKLLNLGLSTLHWKIKKYKL